MALPAPGAGVGGMLFGQGGGDVSDDSGTGATMGGTTAAPPMNGLGHVKGPVGGKASTSQDLLSPHSGMRSTITKGDQLSRLMGHYGKNAGGGLSQIRGGTGQMRRIRGGLGPGKTGTPGTSKDYSMSTPDTE